MRLRAWTTASICALLAVSASSISAGAASVHSGRGARSTIPPSASDAAAATPLSALTATSVSPVTTAGPFKVVGNRMLNGAGQPFSLHGVDWPSLDWSCHGQHADGLSDGIAAGEFTTMRSSWHANAVRIPLNQDLWLPGSSRYCPAYRNTVATVVKLVESNSMVPVLDLHSSDGGSLTRTVGSAECMADQNSLVFWRSVAEIYRSDHNAMFELYNEPHDVPWSVWRDGGVFTCVNGEQYAAAGMQQLINTVRSTGANNVVLAGGNDWSADLSGVARWPLDGTNIGYAVHPYLDADSVDTAVWDKRFGFLTRQAPVVATEFGRSQCPSPYTPSADQQLVSYFHNHGIGYTAWAWWVGGCNFPSIISDEAGTCFQGGCVDKADMAAVDAGTATIKYPALSPAVRTGFEDGTTQGWGVAWGSTIGGLANTSGPKHSGTRSLSIKVTGTGYPAIGTRQGLSTLGTGSLVTMYVYSPVAAAVDARIWAFDASWRQIPSPSRPLTPGWNTLNWTLPSMTKPAELGLQIDNGGAWTGSLAVDDISWTPRIVAPATVTDFEDAQPDGWSAAWGPVAVANTTARSYSGSHALAVTVTGTSYPAIATRSGLSGITAGATVTMHLYAPAGSAISVQPYVFDASWSMITGPTDPLAPGWNTITWQVPINGPNALGLQINNSTDWNGDLVLDAVSF